MPEAVTPPVLDPGQDTHSIETALRAERLAIVAYADRYGAQVDGLIAKGRIGAEEGTLLKERIRVFAGNIAIGLHLP
jgi:hypothetical protein